MHSVELFNAMICTSTMSLRNEADGKLAEATDCRLIQLQINDELIADEATEMVGEERIAEYNLFQQM
jgi:hypothetical protein